MKRIVLSLFALVSVWSAQAQDAAPAPFDTIAYYSATKKKVDGGLNGSYTTFAPSISADGRTIIFEANQGGSYKLFESRLNEQGKWSEPVALTNINSFGDSTDLIGGPSISFDGNTLFFFAAIGQGGSEDIYVSTREKDGWSKPTSLGAPINTTGYEAFPSISADGKTLYFVRQNIAGPQDKDLRKLNQFCTSIYQSKKKEDGTWDTPKRLPAPINQECEKAPKIMADGKTLIFSSNRPGGKGDYDMYQSKLNVLGEWSIPVPLDYVNTASSDQLPCISAQGDLMYYTYNNESIFSVEIPPSLRQFMNNVVQGYITDEDTRQGIAAEIIITDAFTSEEVMRLTNNPSDGRYTVVLPVGRSFNMEVRKEGYSSYAASFDLTQVKKYQEQEKNIALFKTVKLTVSVNDIEIFEAIPADIKVKNPGASGFFKEVKNDVQDGRVLLELPIGKQYEIIVSSPNFKGEFFTFDASGLVLYRNFEKEVELVPEKVGVMINVADLVNNSKVKSKILLRNKDRDEVIEVSGNEMVQLRSGDRYELEATSDQGYAFNSTTIDVAKGGETQVEVKLQKLEKDTKLTLRDINFESNSAQLSDVSFTELQRVIKLMTENPDLKVEIAAHTDDIGSDAYNLMLSNNRAQSVLNYLSDYKIDPSRLVAKGYGESQPKVPNSDEEQRAINRRVELKILGI
ncbi:OmpA family protein [Cytophagales bacterium LB-30]|uniref:OmpA family protein n=1 Tax=Shiella aurantiaca TaxID=3058365 RepID=A0ABT8F257_9BACT|nr:OmpA family protein [Shiella aurantiaca]MDN4164535.1 OmpA family protein [Shiella aurantiaca]